MDKRYQVFVSSTYDDLREERSEVMQALLELECMPAGMELFPAATDSQWDWIRRVIDESDYYIVLVGGRYGSKSKNTGLSFTEMEYRYAVEIGKPVLGFIREDPDNIPSKFYEAEPANRKKLENFKDFVKSRLCKFYDSPQDLGAKVSRSITQLKNRYPAIGWIRADQLASVASAEDQLRLAKENEELRSKLFRLEKGGSAHVDDLASGNDEFSLKFEYTILEKNPDTGRFRKSGESESDVNATWDEIFKAIGPTLLRERRYFGYTRYDLVSLIANRSTEKLAKAHPKADSFSNFNLIAECRETIYMQLRALNFIEIDDEGDWRLTTLGDQYLTDLFAVKRNANKTVDSTASRATGPSE